LAVFRNYAKGDTYAIYLCGYILYSLENNIAVIYLNNNLEIILNSKEGD
jgi:hypothetical protein